MVLNIDERTREKIDGLVQLAKRGVDGERGAAYRALERLAKKYNLNLNDIMEDKDKKVQEYWIMYANKEEKLILRHVLWKYGDILDTWLKRWDNPRKTYFETTCLKYIEILTAWDAYKRVFREEKNALTKGFIMKHQIYGTGGITREWEDLTEKEKDEIRRASQMADGMSDVDLNKRLSTTKLA